MIYGKEFEDRKNKVNQICKNYIKKDDLILLRTLYSCANINEVQPGNNLKDKLSKTPFSNESMGKFLTHFKKEEFSKYSTQNLEVLFQELHNRQCKALNYEPRCIVSVSRNIDTSTNGYMTPGTNKLNMNGAMISRYNYIPASYNNYGKNMVTIGAHSALTLIHETQHACQMEGIMNFALNRETSKEQRGKDALFFLKMAVSNYAQEKDSKALKDYIKNNYVYDFMEHDANMAAVKFVRDQIKQGNIKDDVFLDALAYRTTRDIHLEEQPLVNRIATMEVVIKKYMELFNAIFKDGPLKQQLSKALNEYTKVDKNGHSPLRDGLIRDFEEAKQLIDYCKQNSNHHSKERDNDGPVLRLTR
ncbi:MAG: hypothetical protein IJW82_02760 [Clostridia bacterium]|nr:hypothetical protein [Clostridia bacterium]